MNGQNTAAGDLTSDTGRPSTLAGLRRKIAALESSAEAGTNLHVPFEVPEIDRILGGGLMRGTLHEVAPETMRETGAATAFSLALALRVSEDEHPLAFIGWDFAGREAGLLYGPGLVGFGLDPGRLLMVRTARVEEALWASEECLACGAVTAAVVEIPDRNAAGTLTATRRLALAARKSGATAILLRSDGSLPPTAAATRWQVSAAPSHDATGIGRPAFALTLHRNRTGPTGHWIVEWNSHVRSFHAATLSFGVAATSFGRPAAPRATPLRRAG